MHAFQLHHARTAFDEAIILWHWEHEASPVVALVTKKYPLLHWVHPNRHREGEVASG